MNKNPVNVKNFESVLSYMKNSLQNFTQADRQVSELIKSS